MLLRFEPSGVEVRAVDGERVVDICDANPSADVPFSCRAANCATCRVVVVEGSHNLEPPDDDELGVLDIFGEDPSQVRLACQLVLAVGPSDRVVLRVVSD